MLEDASGSACKSRRSPQPSAGPGPSGGRGAPRLWLTLPPEGETLDLAVLPQALAKGDRVKVLEPFTTDDQGEARLVVEKGDHGVAWGTGDDGDLVTVFTRDQETMHWVRAPNFVDLKLRKAEAPPSTSSSCRPSATACGGLSAPATSCRRPYRGPSPTSAGVGGRRLGCLEDVAGRA